MTLPHLSEIVSQLESKLRRWDDSHSGEHVQSISEMQKIASDSEDFALVHNDYCLICSPIPPPPGVEVIRLVPGSTPIPTCDRFDALVWVRPALFEPVLCDKTCPYKEMRDDSEHMKIREAAIQPICSPDSHCQFCKIHTACLKDLEPLTGGEDDLDAAIALAEQLRDSGWRYHQRWVSADKVDDDSVAEPLTPEAKVWLDKLDEYTKMKFTTNPTDAPPKQSHDLPKDGEGRLIGKWSERFDFRLEEEDRERRMTDADLSYSMKDIFLDVARDFARKVHKKLASINMFVVRALGKKPRPCVTAEMQNVFSLLPSTVKYPEARDAFSTRYRYAAKTDIDKGFRHVVLNPQLSQDVVMAVNGRALQMQRLPFGVDWGPRAFCSLLNNTLADFQYQENLIVYVDDILVLGESPEEVTKVMYHLVKFLGDKRITVSLQKLFARPCQIISFLGTILDLRRSRWRVSEKLIGNTQVQQTTVRRYRPGLLCKHQLRAVQSLTGKVQFATNACRPLALVRDKWDQAAATTWWTGEAAELSNAFDPATMRRWCRATCFGGTSTWLVVTDASNRPGMSTGASIIIPPHQKAVLDTYDLSHMQAECEERGQPWSSTAAELTTSRLACERALALAREKGVERLNISAVTDSACAAAIHKSMSAPSGEVLRDILAKFYQFETDHDEEVFVEMRWHSRWSEYGQYADSASELRETWPLKLGPKAAQIAHVRGLPQPTHVCGVDTTAAPASLIPSVLAMRDVASSSRQAMLQTAIANAGCDPKQGFAGVLQWRPSVFNEAHILFPAWRTRTGEAATADFDALFSWFTMSHAGCRTLSIFVQADEQRTVSPLVLRLADRLEKATKSVVISRKVRPLPTVDRKGYSRPISGFCISLCNYQLSTMPLRKWSIREFIDRVCHTSTASTPPPKVDQMDERDEIDKTSGEAKTPGPTSLPPLSPTQQAVLRRQLGLDEEGMKQPVVLRRVEAPVGRNPLTLPLCSPDFDPQFVPPLPPAPTSPPSAAVGEAQHRTRRARTHAIAPASLSLTDDDDDGNAESYWMERDNPCRGADCSRLVRGGDRRAYVCDAQPCRGWMVCFHCVPPPQQAGDDFPLLCPRHQHERFKTALMEVGSTKANTIGRLYAVLTDLCNGTMNLTRVTSDKDWLLPDVEEERREAAFAPKRRREVVLKFIKMTRQLFATTSKVNFLSEDLQRLEEVAMWYVVERLRRRLFRGWRVTSAPVVSADMSTVANAILDLGVCVPLKCGTAGYLASRGGRIRKPHSEKFPITRRIIVTGLRARGRSTPTWAARAMDVQSLMGCRGGLLPLLRWEHLRALKTRSHGDLILVLLNFSHKDARACKKGTLSRPYRTVLPAELLPWIADGLIAEKKGPLIPDFEYKDYGDEIRRTAEASGLLPDDLQAFKEGITPHSIRVGCDIVMQLLLHPDIIDAHLNWAVVAHVMAKHYGALDAGALVAALRVLEFVTLLTPVPGWYLLEEETVSRDRSPLDDEALAEWNAAANDRELYLEDDPLETREVYEDMAKALPETVRDSLAKHPRLKVFPARAAAAIRARQKARSAAG